MSRRSMLEGAYEIDSLPGQPQIAVCHSFFVQAYARGRGNAHVLKRHQELTLADLNYDFAICTVAAGNAAQKRVLAAAGWQKLTEFSNRRSCETTEIWGATVE